MMESTMKNRAKKLIKDYTYHRDHKRSAFKVLKNIEAVKGKTQPKLTKLSDDYASDVLGWKGYAPWLHVYCAIAGDFKEGWIPDNYYGKIVVPILKGGFANILSMHSLTGIIFNSNYFHNLGCYINGSWFSKNYELISGRDLKKEVFKNSNVAVYKVDDSSQGTGVFFFEKSNFELKKIQSLGNGVLQDYINQHNIFKELMPNSVTTLRCTTVIDNRGEASMRACYLRIGRDTDTHINTRSEIKVSVDIKTGQLYEDGYTTDWTPINSHPDSNISFSEIQIPNFAKCVSVALELHKRIPFIQSIGWDMIVDENDEVKVMEWNGGHNDIKFSEATQGPCFSDLGWHKLWR